MDLKFDFIRIPEGEFVMGSNLSFDRLTQSDESPAHNLYITDYYISRFPVTNAQYRLFLEATGARPPMFGWPEGRFPQDKADHPVVGVSYGDAVAFCQWAAKVIGLPLRLPSEPEWEKAARGCEGQAYPWGNTWEGGRCNSYESKVGGTSPVGEFSPQGDSPFGVAEMGGNVQEWTSSLFGTYPYDPEDGRERLVYNPEASSLMPGLHETGCTSNALALEAALDKTVVRGGSFREEKVKSRCAYRGWAAPMHRSVDTGFRLVYEPAGS